MRTDLFAAVRGTNSRAVTGEAGLVSPLLFLSPPTSLRDQFVMVRERKREKDTTKRVAERARGRKRERERCVRRGEDEV